MNTPPPTVTAIDPDLLPKHFDSLEAEKRWNQCWQETGIYHYRPDEPREKTFVVDTPPPTVSGELHVGHVFSYTHTDVIVRYQRMRGKKIFYPMGWDDNGLPTERRVQNYYHVKCDPRLPYQPGMAAAQVTGKEREAPPRFISRRNFIELCHALTGVDEKNFQELWQRLGLSVDWRETYATIDDHCRRLAQLSFLDLLHKGHIYHVEAPTMWDVDFQTAVAQAEVEDRNTPGAFFRLRFGVEGSDRTFLIATTRPELLAACVGVTAHPDDGRYRDLFGKRAVTPLFRVPVPIFPSGLANPEKGTGILMVCTFGDATDVQWWREQKLALRQIVGRDGRLLPATFGIPGWESLDPAGANRCYAQLAGKNLKAAQKLTAELVRDPAHAASGSEPPLAAEPQPLEHPVKFFEKGDRPLEFISSRQWFVRLLDKKEALLAYGDRIHWHPDHMRLRYRNWTENLQLDWCISRQRYFGVSFPVWYPLDAVGQPEYDRPLLAPASRLPVDPTSEVPEGYRFDQRDKPGGFTAEADVFDTWFTSSLTPQVGSRWGTDAARHARLFPADLRPQSHEIIRTWAFYTIAKGLLHEEQIPWKHVAISGWVLDPDRKKMSKSKGNTVTPLHLLDKYYADGVRYWSANAKLGTDTAFDEQVMTVGKRLATKLFNAGKYVLSQTGPAAPVTQPLDLAFAWKLRELVRSATRAHEEFDYATALAYTESFFWGSFTDTYLELVKTRARDERPEQAAGRGSAVAALRFGLQVLLRLFAPIQPYITEEVWSWAFARETGVPSIHAASWPAEEEFAGMPLPESAAVFDLAVACFAAVNKKKTASGVSAGREISDLTLAAHPETLSAFAPVAEDVRAAVRAARWQLVPAPEAVPGSFEVRGATFAERPAAPPA